MLITNKMISDKLVQESFSDIWLELQEAKKYQIFLSLSRLEKIKYTNEQRKKFGPDIFKAIAYFKKCYIKHKDRI
jgi:hypothetical protein